MKILFVTTDRHAAQLGAQALQRMAPGGKFTWTQTPEAAFRWLQANRDAAAVVMEAESQNADRAGFREQVRALGLRTRISSFSWTGASLTTLPAAGSPITPLRPIAGVVNVTDGPVSVAPRPDNTGVL